MFKIIEEKKLISHTLTLFSVLSIGIILNVFPRIISLYNESHIYVLTQGQSLIYLGVYIVFSILFLFIPKLFHQESLIPTVYYGTLLSYILTIFGAFYSDILYLYTTLSEQSAADLFSEKISVYLSQEWLFYTFLLLGLVISLVGTKLFLYKDYFNSRGSTIKNFFLIFVFLTPLIIIWPLEYINLKLFTATNEQIFSYLPFSIVFSQNIFYVSISAFLTLFLFSMREKYNITVSFIRKSSNLLVLMCGITFLIKLYLMLYPYMVLSERIGESPARLMYQNVKNIGIELVAVSPIFFLLLFMGFLKKMHRKTMFNSEQDDTSTTGNFGSASWATVNDLKKLNAYDEKNGLPIGTDSNNRMLYLELCNKLTISPQGGGKTSTSSMLALLTYDGPALVWDIKGELWAVTARYRSQVLGRNVVVIDPYGVTSSPDFAKGKSESLLKKYTINPFDWIPEDKKSRDRILNTFAASFVINEGGTATHFDENAKILIRGYIDYLMNQDPLILLPFIRHTEEKQKCKILLTFGGVKWEKRSLGITMQNLNVMLQNFI